MLVPLSAIVHLLGGMLRRFVSAVLSSRLRRRTWDITEEIRWKISILRMAPFSGCEDRFMWTFEVEWSKPPIPEPMTTEPKLGDGYGTPGKHLEKDRSRKVIASDFTHLLRHEVRCVLKQVVRKASTSNKHLECLNTRKRGKEYRRWMTRSLYGSGHRIICLENVKSWVSWGWAKGIERRESNLFLVLCLCSYGSKWQTPS
jgi:hypothetical protein